ncbi:hypothetical protein BDF21DRAFT_435477 [Thamnidium elegans]|nr:hypothetical protein BDF21DRAFT_435477 [Thamnidium elegans]
MAGFYGSNRDNRLYYNHMYDIRFTDSQLNDWELSIDDLDDGGTTDATAVPIEIEPLHVAMTDAEIAVALPTWLAEYDTLRANRVTRYDHLHLAELYNWYTLFLSLLHSGGGTTTDLLQVALGNNATGNYQQMRDMISCGKTIHFLLNQCGLGLLVRPDWFPFACLMSKLYTQAERELLIQSDDFFFS